MFMIWVHVKMPPLASLQSKTYPSKNNAFFAGWIGRATNPVRQSMQRFFIKMSQEKSSLKIEVAVMNIGVTTREN